MKRLILRNSGGGISITVDIEVVLSVYLLVYLLSQLHQAITRGIAFMTTHI